MRKRGNMQDFIYVTVVFGFFAICLVAVGFFRMEEVRETAQKEKE